jgi:TetR/AcrR family transcriptional regulator, transcriptional repressor for nem operon
MRLSREAKAEHHDKITSAAGKMLRKRGIDQTSVADLMQAAGLTHGGFYRHFKSKDELVAISAKKASDDIIQQYEEYAAQSNPQAALEQYVVDYISDEHRDDPSIGCVVAACGAEASRQNDVVRQAFTECIRNLLNFAEAGLVCPEEARSERAIELGCLMLGAVVVARATNDKELSENVLASARKRALELIQETT